MARASKRSTRASPVLASLSASERAGVLDALVAAHLDLAAEVEHLAGALLSSLSVEDVMTGVEAALALIPLEALGSRAGRAPGRGYVHESDAAWELVEEAIEPFRSDVVRRAKLGFTEAAALAAIAIVAGLHRLRDPDVGTVLAYAGGDAPGELACDVFELTATLGLVIPEEAAWTYWPEWADDLS